MTSAPIRPPMALSGTACPQYNQNGGVNAAAPQDARTLDSPKGGHHPPAPLGLAARARDSAARHAGFASSRGVWFWLPHRVAAEHQPGLHDLQFLNAVLLDLRLHVDQRAVFWSFHLVQEHVLIVVR